MSEASAAAPGGRDSKKVLIVTYYWPPSGGSGVQRWLKFVKYLPEFGWQPFVFTPENPSVEIQDNTLLADVPTEAEVIRFPIWEPYKAFDKLTRVFGKQKIRQIDQVVTGKKSLFQSITTWIRGNILIPDPRKFWVKPSVAFLKDLLPSNGIKTIITTGPPHSMHLIGLKLKQGDPKLHWIVDLRDPWSEWDVLDNLSLTGWARRRHQALEREVLKTADEVITIAPFHVKRFEALRGRKVQLITNGFDESDFAGIRRERTNKFTIRHIGMVDELRDPRPFMEALRRVMEEVPTVASQIKLEFVGSVNQAFLENVANDQLLSQVTTFSEPLPHESLVKLYAKTDVQLLVLAHTVLAQGNLPGKFFEYLASGNFILGVGPEDGDAAAILNETRAGVMIGRDRVDELKKVLLLQFENWQSGKGQPERNVSGFSRKALTRALKDLINLG